MKKKPVAREGIATIASAINNELSTTIIPEKNKKSTQNGKKFAISSKKYALPVVDSDGKTLSAAQQEYFKDSQVRDDKGRLLKVYHGTEGEFYTFDKALRGSVTGTKDAKLGFFFTNNKNVAQEYAVEAQDNKFFNLMHKIANGDRKILNILGKVDGYKELVLTNDRGA